MIEDLPNLLVAWGIQLSGVISPGPGVALILAVATSRGRAPALVTCVGIGCGAVLLATLTVLGLAAILTEMQSAMVAVRILGAAYLAWLAWGAFRRAASPPPAPKAAGAAPALSVPRTILGGFLFQIGNPKAIFFWIAVAAVGALDKVAWPSLVAFVAGAFIISAAGHGAWAILLSSAPFRAAYARGRRWIEAALGAVFAAFAIRLATERG